MEKLHRIAQLVLIVVCLFSLLVVEAKQNYEEALKVTTWGDNSDSSNREVMQAFGFKDATGTEVNDPALSVMVSAYVRFIFN